MKGERKMFCNSLASVEQIDISVLGTDNQHYDLHAQDFYHCENATLSIEKYSRPFPKFKITLQFECDSYSMETLRKNLIY